MWASRGRQESKSVRADGGPATRDTIGTRAGRPDWSTHRLTPRHVPCSEATCSPNWGTDTPQSRRPTSSSPAERYVSSWTTMRTPRPLVRCSSALRIPHPPRLLACTARRWRGAASKPRFAARVGADPALNRIGKRSGGPPRNRTTVSKWPTPGQRRSSLTNVSTWRTCNEAPCAGGQGFDAANISRKSTIGCWLTLMKPSPGRSRSAMTMMMAENAIGPASITGLRLVPATPTW